MRRTLAQNPTPPPAVDIVWGFAQRELLACWRARRARTGSASGRDKDDGRASVSAKTRYSNVRSQRERWCVSIMR
jgi:hypothetical protein